MPSPYEITAFEFEGYKPFRARQRFDLKRLNLVFGRNSAGKSAVVRVPAMLFGPGRQAGVAGVALGGGALTFGQAYEDVVYGRRRAQLDLAVEASIDALAAVRRVDPSVGGTRAEEVQRRAGDRIGFRFAAEIWPAPGSVAGSAEQVVRRVELASDSYGYVWQGERQEDGQYRVVQRVGDGGPDPFVTPCEFDGLVPADPWRPLGREEREFYREHEVLLSVAGAFWRLQVDHLGALRAAPAFFQPAPTRPVRDVGLAGERALDLLAGEAMRGRETPVADAVCAWASRILRWETRVEQSGEPGKAGLAFSLVLRRSPDAPWIQAPLLGMGTQQVLPVIVQQVALAAGVSDAAVAVVEEPESHLHPAAHAQLAELFVATARSERAPPVIVETHSEVLLLRVRACVARGEIAADRVGIWFVDDSGDDVRVRELKMDPADGWIEDWPAGVFEEDAAERRAIGRATREAR